jgi:hypothetical protein
MNVNPAELGEALARDYERAQRLFRQAVARQFVLGRELVDLRERLGAVAFAKWMTEYCAAIPPDHAEALMQYSLSSRLAEKVDAVIEPHLDS